MVPADHTLVGVPDPAAVHFVGTIGKRPGQSEDSYFTFCERNKPVNLLQRENNYNTV